MKAARIHQLGDRSGLRVDDLPEPTPGPGEAAVRIHAASLNYRDLLVLKGLYNPKIALPAVPLSDGAGDVSAIGAGVSRVKVGDRVAAAFMPGWINGPATTAGGKTALGAGGIGMLAETVVLPAEGLVKLPNHLTWEDAATLPCAAVTAWHALFSEGHLQPDDIILTLGTGGVSLFAIQFAHALGARVIATTSRDDKAERLRAMGVNDIINYQTTPDWDKAVRALTGGDGVSHVVEVGGAGTLSRSLRAVKTAGRVSLIGVLTGGKSEVDVLPILMRNLTVQGIYVGSRAMFEDMNLSIEKHALRPVIDRVFSLDETAEAYRYLESGAHFGKVVIRIR
jgi:NADPH:quinone reductase-like Zn-dependent oxidoreductase